MVGDRYFRVSWGPGVEVESVCGIGDDAGEEGHGMPRIVRREVSEKRRRVNAYKTSENPSSRGVPSEL